MRSNIEASKQRSNEKHGTTKRTRIIRIIGRSLLSVIILIGLAIITCWIIVFPKTPRFLVETGQVIAHSSTRTMLNASIAYTVKSYNPNKRASIHMDSMRMIVTNMDQTFSSDIPTFTQKPGNLTVLSSAVQGNFEYPFGFKEEIDPNLRFEAKVSYSVERWTSKPRLLEIYCDRLWLRINDSRTFENTECKVDL